MADQYKLPTSVSDDGSGDNLWVNPNNVKLADNNLATSALDPTNGSGISGILTLTGFGFTIPTGATINGIFVIPSQKCSINTPITGAVDLTIRLVKAGVAGGTQKADTVNHYPTTLTERPQGGATDLWGTTWSPAEINAADFGCEFAAQSVLFFNSTVSVNYILLIVFYTVTAIAYSAVVRVQVS
jgi:large repetitive protein